MIYGLTSRSRCAFSINASGEGKSSSENVNTLPHDYYSLNPGRRAAAQILKLWGGAKPQGVLCGF